jgi:large subunit ribosomal protein L25
MKTFELEGKSREVIAASADRKRALKAMRKNDLIPAVMYGGEKVVHFTVSKEAVRNLVYTPEIYVVNLTIDGVKHLAIIKDMQFAPVAELLLHMDFLEISDKKPIEMEIPVVLEGHAEGVKAGGKLALQMRKLKAKAVYTDLPEKFVINVDHLGIGKTIQVGSLHFDGIELMNSKNSVVCGVQTTRAADAAATTAAAPTDAAAAPAAAAPAAEEKK